MWTRRQFAAQELRLWPEADHIRDRFWSAAGSALVAGAEALHPKRKKLVIDGRSRSNPGAGEPDDQEPKVFSWFFLVTAIDDEEAGGQPPNLLLGSAKCSSTTVFSGKGIKKDITAALELPGVPFLYNPKKARRPPGTGREKGAGGRAPAPGGGGQERKNGVGQAGPGRGRGRGSRT